MELILLFTLIMFILFIIHTSTPKENNKRVNNSDTPQNNYKKNLPKNNKKYNSEKACNIEHLPEVAVNYVIDGDTVFVIKNRKKIKVRLDSIDCPEDGQEWGKTATYGLIKLVGKRKIRMEEHGVDCYGRIIATLYVKQGHEWINVNEKMVMLGHAWVMRNFYHHLPQHRKNKLNRLEKWAQSKKVGLWKTSNPIPPWHWRNANAPTQCQTSSSNSF